MAKLFLFDCDPFKNDSCSKEDCYIYGGHCSKTSIKGYSKTKTNQDKIAEIVRMSDH